MSRVTEASFGAWLRRLREAAGLTQEELASRSGMTSKAISALERGVRRRPYPHTVRAISEALALPEEQRAALAASVPGRGGARAGAAAAGGGKPELPPVPPTRLVGRERELGEIGEFLGGRGDVRLLTLTGPGGVGKTRLALEAAREASGHYEDGAVFVALAPVGDVDLVLPTVVRALGLREMGGHSPREVLHTYLRERRMLVVVDNFEHLMEAAPEVAALLEACPDLTVLVTSRAPLRLRAEQEYPVGPLALPVSAGPAEAAEVADSSSGRLFLERARAASAAFEVTGRNAGAVAEICRRLEGLPLALELAAAKVRFLGPAALLSRLDRALEAGGARDLPERQRTVRATLDWSYELLHDPERELFRSLSVFAGGFTLEAAEEVCATDEIEAGEVLLGNLVEQSLVVAETGPGGRARYRLLEPVRQYAREKLEESGEAGEVRRRHALYYLGLAERAEPQIKGRDQVAWLDRLEAENDNLRAAIGRSLDMEETPTAARFGWALGMYWVMRTRHGEGRLLMERTLARSAELPAPLRARVIWALASCLYGSGSDERLMAVAEEGVTLSRVAGDRHGQAYTLAVLGFAALQRGDRDRAERVLEESLEIARELGDEWGSSLVLNHLAAASLGRGEPLRAAGHAQEALALARRTGDRLAAGVALSLLAQMAWASDEREAAAGHWREALAMASELSDRAHSAYCLQGLAAVAAARGEHRRAARLLGAAEVLLEAAGLVLYAHARNELHQRTEEAVRERLGEEAWGAARDEGRAMDLDRAVEYALEAGEV